MTAKTKTRDRFERLAELCLALPATIREDKGDHASFLVGKKVFAYYLNDHHGDGIIGVCCKALPGDNQRLVEGNPGKFYMPAYIGSRGWVGLRLDLPSVDWTEVREIILGSYMQLAPQRLVKLL